MVLTIHSPSEFEPIILYSTPILIPFIPGATLYYAMNDLVRKSPAAEETLQLLIYQVGAMALGILVAEVMILFFKSTIPTIFNR